jgi:hypothetical protein
MIVEKENEFCVYKEGEDKQPVGESLGCHPSKEEARAQRRALYANMENENKSVKAVGDWELEVLAIPFGDVNNLDSDGEFFSSKTNLHLDTFKTPLIPYYHSFGPDNKPLDTPEIIGKPKGYEIRPDGVWWRVVLDKTNEFAKRIWEAAKQGLARASSGSIAHLVRKAMNGEILEWPLAEISLIDMGDNRAPANKWAVALPVMKSVYDQAGMILPDIQPANTPEVGEAGEDKPADAVVGNSKIGAMKMDEKEMKSAIDSALTAFEAKQKADAEAKAAADKAEKERVDAAVLAAKAEWEKEAAKSNRLPLGGKAPIVTKYSDSKFDNLDASEQAVLVGMLKAAKKDVSETAIKSLAAKLEEDKSPVGEEARKAMKAVGMKASEIDYSTYASYGDEWVGAAYSQAIWDAVRMESVIVDKLPQVEFRQGVESMIIPIESTDPIFYKVAQATATESTLKVPQATVSNSPLGTGSQSLTLAKLGGRTIFTGEMEEDSLIPWVAQLKKQLVASGKSYLDSAIIDGDTEASASTNINDIAGTPAATDWFMVFNGFRKLALVTNTDNSRAGGALTVEDFMETLKLVGTAGIGGLDPVKCAFLSDVNTYYKALQLEEVKTRDVFGAPVIENGVLTGMWGHKYYVSADMHKASAARKAQVADGKIDLDTTEDNVSGSLLAVRWDQWMFGWKRRMTMEITRIPNADSSEIVALMRCGLIYRDTEASAITYGITV